jgi:hypothetical protein
MPDSATRSCFVICPIGEDDSEVRKHSDNVLQYVIGPAVAELHYHPIRADLVAKPGEISLDIMTHLLNDDLVIADLTGRNANVFYELADLGEF